MQINPQPSDKTLAAIYGDHYYDAWGVNGKSRDEVLRLKAATFKRFILRDMPAGAKLLDCGAAFGTLMEGAKEMGLEPYGIELAPEAAANIATQFGKERVFNGLFENAVFPMVAAIGGFDVVCMCDFIEHVRKPQIVLDKAFELLRPGGILVITTPDSKSLSARFMKGKWLHQKTEHIVLFSRKTLSRLLTEIGFTVTSVGRAKKVLDLQYLYHQLNTYPHPLITPLFNIWFKFIDLLGGFGRKMKAKPSAYSFGEMHLIAKKREG
jgi:2-polyprenyl-3-methyl-5-hydroxy-6-metoxy-1,4-benzoquinol methylase